MLRRKCHSHLRREGAALPNFVTRLWRKTRVDDTLGLCRFKSKDCRCASPRGVGLRRRSDRRGRTVAAGRMAMLAPEVGESSRDRSERRFLTIAFVDLVG